MGLKLSKIKVCLLIFFILFFSQSCANQQINFDFSGRKVLYTDIIGGEDKLILFNIDTDKKLEIDNLEEIQSNLYSLYNNGEEIIVNSFHKDGEIYNYNILKKEKNKLNIPFKRDLLITSCHTSTNNKFLYISFNNRIFQYSTNDFSLVKDYSIDSTIFQLEVNNQNTIAYVYPYFENYSFGVSEIHISDLHNAITQVLPYRGYIYGWSKNSNNLLIKSGGIKIINYPALTVKEIDFPSLDSLVIFRSINFISDTEIIFSAFKKNEDLSKTNLYILNWENNEIKQLTNSNSQKEIKSSFY